MAKDKPQPQTGPEIEEYSTTATPKAYAGSVPVFCAHDAIVPLKDLRPNPKNPNQHPPEQIKLLASIIRATGWRAPITVSKRSGLVTKGHGRLMAAQLDDLTDAPVDYQDYASEAEELADLTADNRIAELATTDNKMLAEVFADIDTGEIPFMLSGYTEDEYGDLVTALSEALHDDKAEQEDGDTEPEMPPEEPFTEPGDLWLLGNHRLYCGDSLKIADVQKATDGQRADLVFTDPPYGMGKESDGVQNDNQNQNDLLEFNKKWIALSFSILKENGSWYCWGIDEPLMDIYAFILRPMIAANQITFRNYITWAKHSAFGVNSELTRSYPRETEKCLFVMCGVEGFNNNKDHFNDAYEAILNYMIGEAQKVGLKAKQLTEITGVQMWGHWFSKSQFTPIPEWHYKKLQQAFKGRAFSLPHDQVMKLRNKPSEAYQNMKAEAMELRAFFDNTHNDSDEHDIMTDVWRFPITNTAERDDAGGHATPKPIALCERAILSSSRPGELVVDFFGGSGSTLIACENTGRTCAMIELEPKWCDVIVRRYTKTTGDNNVRCVRQGRELPREEIAAIFEPDEEGGEQE